MSRKKRSLWVMALGMAFAGFGTPSRAAAVPAQQSQAQDRDKNQERKDDQNGDKKHFQQGFQDAQHDRQFGANGSEHPRPSGANDLRAYEDGYKQGSRNTTTSGTKNTTMSGPKAPGKVRKFWWTRRH
jgi:hypothetical protein